MSRRPTRDDTGIPSGPVGRLHRTDLVAHCRAEIAHYKCPKSVEFLDALPLSGAGKVLKGKLREPYWQGRSRQIS
jgi:acyl-CoA synthetase (AMP-forming)/AMP-acid ligase II